MAVNRILITNGGAHEPSKWAEVTASSIIDLIEIDPSADRKYSTAKRKCEIALLDVLEEHHGRVQASEKTKLQASAARFAEAIDPSEHLEEATKAAVAVFAGTEFQDHFDKGEVQEVVASIIAGHMASIQDIERQWHADRNPSIAAGQAYKAAGPTAVS